MAWLRVKHFPSWARKQEKLTPWRFSQRQQGWNTHSANEVVGLVQWEQIWLHSIRLHPRREWRGITGDHRDGDVLFTVISDGRMKDIAKTEALRQAFFSPQGQPGISTGHREVMVPFSLEDFQTPCNKFLRNPVRPHVWACSLQGLGLDPSEVSAGLMLYVTTLIPSMVLHHYVRLVYSFLPKDQPL